MNFDSNAFGANVQGKILIEEKTLRDVAKETGISISTLSRITKGEDPDIHTFATLVRWMDVDANVFIKSLDPLPPDKDEWAALYLSLLNLDIPYDIIKAFMAIARLIREQ